MGKIKSPAIKRNLYVPFNHRASRDAVGLVTGLAWKYFRATVSNLYFCTLSQSIMSKFTPNRDIFMPGVTGTTFLFGRMS